MRLRVPIVPPTQMKDGGVALSDLLPYIGKASGEADTEDVVEKMMNVEGAAPSGWRDIEIRIEPNSTFLSVHDTISWPLIPSRISWFTPPWLCLQWLSIDPSLVAQAYLQAINHDSHALGLTGADFPMLMPIVRSSTS